MFIPSALAFATKMRGYMLEIRAGAMATAAVLANEKKPAPRGSVVCTMKKCKNSWSASTVFAEGVRRELESLHSDFATELFERF